jgi:hypothetical protein
VEVIPEYRHFRRNPDRCDTLGARSIQVTGIGEQPRQFA